MAVDDSNLYSRTRSKLNSCPNRHKSARRSSLPPDILLENDFKGKLQRNVKNIEPIHPRRPKKRPSIFSGRKCYVNGVLVQYLLNLFGNIWEIQWLPPVRVYSVFKTKAVFTDRFNKVPFMLHYVTIKVMEPKHKIKFLDIFGFICLLVGIFFFNT